MNVFRVIPEKSLYNKGMENSIPAEVAAHLKELVRTSEESWAKEEGVLEKLSNLWEEKNRLFEEQIRLLGMNFENSVDAGDPRGMILATYSGSLVSLGPGNPRKFGYASIKIRSDVPDILNREDVSLVENLNVGKVASFEGAPVRHTSALYRIAVVPSNLSEEEQEARVREAMVFLTTTFVHINRQLTSPGETGPGQFDKKSMIKYLAENNDLSQKTVRRLLDDYAVLLETGMLMGKSVPLGRLGRLALNLKPVRKARVGHNPATGEEITIPAKAAHMVPVFRFSSRTKTRAESLHVPLEDE